MFVATEGPPNARIMLVGEAPGKDENTLGKPFVGYAGRTLNQLLGQAGIPRHSCLIANVARIQPPGNRISAYYEDKQCTVPKPQLREWINLLKKEIEENNPYVIVAFGVTALYTLTGNKKISEYRGYVLPCTLVPGKKVVATYHPQAVNYDWKLFFPTVMDLRKAAVHSESPQMPADNRIRVDNASPKQFTEYLCELNQNNNIDKVTLDIETVQPNTHINIIGIAHSNSFGMSVKTLNGRVPAMPERDEALLYRELATLLANKWVIAQNASFDKAVLWLHQHILVKKLWMDTLLAAHCCWPEMPRSLGFLASLCLDVPPWKMTAKENTSLYNADDCINTHGIAEVLDREIDRLGVRETFDFEMAQLDVSIMMQLQGIYVDKEKQQELITEADKRAKECLDALDKILGRRINYSSPKQLQQLLYVDLGLPVQYKRRKSVNDARIVTADSDALKKLEQLAGDNPVFRLILEYKKNTKLISSFLDIEVSPESKVHTSYNITGSKTEDEGRKSFGRWSSSKSIILPFGSGNLQNVPEQARKMYSAGPGLKIVQADYSQAEAVIVAYLIGDRRMQTIFEKSYGLPREEKKQYDIHKFTASDLFVIPFEEVTKDQRRIGKTLRHATNYSAGPGVLATRLGISLKDAKVLIELYHKKNPLLRLWYQRIQDELRQTRTLTNLFGRKHKFHGFWGDSLFRSAYSYKPQSTVGDLLNKALVRFYNKYGKDVVILLQLHDAFYTACKEDEVPDVKKAMKECMQIPIPYGDRQILIDVDFKVGDYWGTLEED